MNDNYKLSIESLKGSQDPKIFKFNNTIDVKPLKGTIGQDRAVEAINFGLNIQTKGFNIYASGPSGTGKQTTVKSYVRENAKILPKPSDWCYVHNFKDEGKPLQIELPAGKGIEYAKDMEELIEGVKNEIPRAFESEEYERRKTKILNGFQELRENALSKIQQQAAKMGFTVEVTTAGIITVPLIEGRPMKRERYSKLPDKQREEIQKKGELLEKQINNELRSIRNQEKEAKKQVKGLDKEIALFAIGHLLDEKKEKYREFPKVKEYLGDVQKDIIDNIDTFKKPKASGGAMIPGLEFLQQKPSFQKYQVNVIVDNSKSEGAPVIFESNPSYYNLFGKIEYRPELGAAVTGFTNIKSGAVHKANGGFLILRAYDVLVNFGSWEALKRTLLREKIKIENIGEQYRAVPVTTIRPEPIPANMKIILIGNPYVYTLLYKLDEDFRKLFKVKADFNYEMDRNKKHIDQYAKFISSRVRNCNLKHFSPSGVAKVVEYGSAVADDQKKLTTKFNTLADIISEASYWAEADGKELVEGSHVQQALDKKKYRSDMIEEKMQEYIKRNTIFINTEGSKTGQVNGLSVLSLGDYMFGKPSRVTARIALGKKGVVNIEREVKLSGPIYNKGVLILSGYINGKYGHNKPISMDASLTFEQEYSGVEGDSASSTEVYAILSSLADIPVKQGIAVTGSVNQKGEVQPIGGVNRKIEGFFETCKNKGLTGEQGVMIPSANIENLMLKDEVIQAVKEGKFNIWSVKSIDEGIEVLTDKQAGEIQDDGSYPVGTIHYLVDKRIQEMAEELQRYQKAA